MAKEYTVEIVGEALGGGTLVMVRLEKGTPLPGAKLTAVFRRYGDRFFAPGGFSGLVIPREVWANTLGGLALEADRKLRAGEITGKTPQAQIPYVEIATPDFKVTALPAKTNPDSTVVFWEVTKGLFTGMGGQLVIGTEPGSGARIFRGLANTKGEIRLFGSHFAFGQAVRAVVMGYDKASKSWKLPEAPNAEYLYRIRTKEDARALYVALNIMEEIQAILQKKVA